LRHSSLPHSFRIAQSPPACGAGEPRCWGSLRPRFRRKELGGTGDSSVWDRKRVEDDQKMSMRTNRKTRNVFPTERVQVSRLGTRLHPTVEIPWEIEARTRDGRKFNLRIMAISREEALQQAHEKFPLITIRRIYKGRIATARRVAGRLSRTAERIGRTAERLLEGSEEEQREAGESLL
jgi:hypothetical protein